MRRRSRVAVGDQPPRHPQDGPRRGVRRRRHWDASHGRRGVIGGSMALKGRPRSQPLAPFRRVGVRVPERSLCSASRRRADPFPANSPGMGWPPRLRVPAPTGGGPESAWCMTLKQSAPEISATGLGRTRHGVTQTRPTFASPVPAARQPGRRSTDVGIEASRRRSTGAMRLRNVVPNRFREASGPLVLRSPAPLLGEVRRD